MTLELAAPGLRRGRGAEIAYAEIRAAIVEGRYEPGHRLVEQRVADELGLSRTPVREAFRLLEVEGLVSAGRHRGTTVRAVSVAEVVDSYELRARLEGLAVYRAGSRTTPGLFADLVDANRRFRLAAADPDASPLDRARRLNTANSEFHARLVDAADQATLSRLLSRTVDIPLVFRSFRTFSAEQVERSATFHDLVVDALRRGEAARASHLMEEHVLQARDVLVARMRGPVDERGRSA